MIGLCIPCILRELLQGMLCQVGSGSLKLDQASQICLSLAPVRPSPAWALLLKLLLEDERRGKRES